MKINYSFPGFSFKKTNIKIILLVLVMYGFFLITTLPASVVFSLISLPKNITLTSSSGTIWSGKVRLLRISGIELGSVNWELHPFNLLLGELSADLSIKNRNQYIKSEINISPSGKIALEETRFQVELSSLAPLTYGMPVSYSGTASGYFPVSFFYKNNYVGLNGKLSLSNIEMISPQPQYFGDFMVDFRAEKEGATSGHIKDVKDANTELNVDGKLKLTKKGQLNVSAKLSARAKDSSLDQMLSFFGRKDENGSVQLNNSVNLWR